jgi:nucleotide-binding universal stress UspA family protein
MYQRILVPVDGSPTSNRGLTEAIGLARLTGARLRLINVVDVFLVAMEANAYAGVASDVIPLMREGGQKILAVARAQVEAAGLGVDAVLREGFAGRVSDLVIDEAKAWSAELIVIGTHGRRGVGRLFMGSDAEQILRLAPVPVLLVRAPGAASA